MRNIILTLSLALSILSCTTETSEMNSEVASSNSLTSKEAITKTAITTTAIPDSEYSLTSYSDCNIDCIAKDSETYFEKTEQQIISWGGPNDNKFSKTVYIKYFNTRTHFVLQVLSTEGFSDLVIDGTTTGISAAANTWATYSYVLDSNWKACDIESLKLQVAGNGPQGVFNISYSLVGLCPEIGCENVFTGTAISCGSTREAEYTFIAKEDISDLKIQGGLTNFTGADAIVTVTGGNLTNTQRTPGGSSNRVITIVGSVEACEKITINIKWNSSNSGGIITGSWSASGTDLSVDNILGLTCGN